MLRFSNCFSIAFPVGCFTYVNSGDCHSDFHHHSPKTYAFALSGSNSHEIQRNRPPLEYRTNSGKNDLRFLAQGADHEASANWLAAGPRGRKNPKPRSDASSLPISSSSSLLLLSAYIFFRSLLLPPSTCHRDPHVHSRAYIASRLVLRF